MFNWAFDKQTDLPAPKSTYTLRVLKKICSVWGIPGPASPAVREDWLYEVSPDFPVRISCKRLEYTVKYTLEDLLTKAVSRTPMYKELDRLQNDFPDYVCAVVFPWAKLGIPGSDMMVMHGGTFARDPDTFRVVRRVTPDQLITVQTLKEWVSGLALDR